MVTSAGGSVVEFSECNLSKDDMCREGVIVMQSLPSPGNGSQVPESYLGVVKYLTSKGLRCIPESDIGLSIVYCSCEKFCNPNHKLQSLFQHHTTPREQTQSSAILVQNTQENSLAVAGWDIGCRKNY
ncbi:uncharacterized protein LOC142328770 [Lycorma delicatula]|uniref:uncharacterized protein LOC142328770 n=1 Tax=Lycorma delicatula TaxID=130591 RepID=UPI003F5114B2